MAGATAAVALVGYGGYRYVKHRRLTGSGLPGLEGTGAPPTEIACEIGPDYPGFVTAEDGACVPSGTTPAGIYVDRACADFIFVPGDDGPQVHLLDLMIAAARNESMVSATAPSADPIVIVMAYLHKFWPNCTWPPEPDGPLRLVHMFEALNFLVGRVIVEEGGRVLGTKSSEIVDELVADRMSKLGLPDFDQEIVPELVDWLMPPGSQGHGPGDVGTGAPTPSEIQRLRKKLCSDPGGLTVFEKLTLINEVVSPLLDHRVALLGANPSLQQLDTMFTNIAHTMTVTCFPISKRKIAATLAKKFAHDLWIHRYNHDQQLDTDVPPPPPWQPIPPGPGGIAPPELPVCAIEPYARNKSVNLPQTSWHTRKIYEYKVFEFAGKWAACNWYDLLVGVCLRVPSPQPYGLLSQYIDDPAMNFDLSKFKIRNGVPAALGDDGGGGPVPWSQFQSPPVWKKQLRVRVIMVVLPNGQHAGAHLGAPSDIHDVTGSAAAAIVDPCQNLTPHWPISPLEQFGVIGWDDNWYAWQSTPQVELVSKGDAIFVRVTYMGVPSFNWSPHNDGRAIFSMTDPVLEIRSLATGVTP